jgi:hypothetical protein
VDAEFADNVLGFRPGDIAGMDARGIAPPGRTEGESEDGAYPEPDEEYQPHARVSNRELPMIAFLMRQKPAFMAFSYGHLETIVLEPGSSPGSALQIIIRFSGTVTREVRIEGRNLLALVRYLQQHRIHWARQAPTDALVRDKKATVITRITVAEVKG